MRNVLPFVLGALDLLEVAVGKPDYRRMARRTALMALAGFFALVALGFAIACVFLALAQATGVVSAALLTAGGVLLVALVILLVAKRL
jgi:hypothetical protein